MKTALLLCALLLSACSSVPISPSAADRVPADRLVSHGTPGNGTLPIIITRDSGLGAMQVHIKVIIDDLLHSARLVESRGEQLNRSMQEMMQRFDNQADSACAISAAIEQMSASNRCCPTRKAAPAA